MILNKWTEWCGLEGMGMVGIGHSSDGIGLDTYDVNKHDSFKLFL